MDAITKLVPDCNIQALEDAIATLNKRCKRLSLSEITLIKIPDHVKACVEVLTVNGTINRVWMTLEAMKEAVEVRKWPHTDTGERMQWWSVSVAGETPKLNGWEFIAILEPMQTDDGATLNLIQCLPGKSCPTVQRERINVCDHCNAKRRRAQTFVVFNAEKNEYKSVGRQCLKDFLGYHGDPEAFLHMAEMLASLEGIMGNAEDDGEDDFGGGFRERAWDTNKFMTTVACRIRLFGWLSATKAHEMYRHDSTKNMVLEILQPPFRPTDADKKAYEKLCADHPMTEADEKLAKDAMEWAASLTSEKIEGSDYLSNVNLVARVGCVSKKTAGVAASIIPAYQREMEMELKRQEFARRPESFHIGTVGTRIALIAVKCEKVIMNETAYGVTGITKMTTLEDHPGSDLTWFASQGRVMDEGETYNVALTVTKHGEFKGRKQTTVNRVTILSDEEVVKIKAKMERKAKKEAKAAKVA